jgi:hypothetical protein
MGAVLTTTACTTFLIPKCTTRGMKPNYSGPISDVEKEVANSQCCEFSELIRACGRNRLHGELWVSSYRQVLLCDQLSRSAFRGTAGASGFDPKAIELARQIFQSGSYKNLELACFAFLITPRQHTARSSPTTKWTCGLWRT